MENRSDFHGFPYNQIPCQTHDTSAMLYEDQLGDLIGLEGWYAAGIVSSDSAPLDFSHLTLNPESENGGPQSCYTANLSIASGSFSDSSQSAFSQYVEPSQAWGIPSEGTDPTSLPPVEVERYTDQQSDTNYTMGVHQPPNVSTSESWDGVPTLAALLETTLSSSVESEGSISTISGLSPSPNATLPGWMEDSPSYYDLQDQLLPQLTESAPLPSAVNSKAKYACPVTSCTVKKPFTRKADLERHTKTRHVRPPPEALFPCRYEGCKHTGPNAFVRRDKLQLHRRLAHKGLYGSLS